MYDHKATWVGAPTPTLVFDVWEHACCLQCGNRKVDFIDAM
ncbi:hypothetical protein C1I97_03975 [Streptomyces sp. NTH33]|nr:hypothetical protein C1I97_03975 [Streptomyces sp. NTH33]